MLEGVAHRTPVLHSSQLGVALKAEHLQRTGSFKIRGAYVRLSALSSDERSRGVVAASAGNHAQGVAWAAARLGIRATIVMPLYAPIAKVQATRRYGAGVVLHGETFEDALDHARVLASEAVFVHAFDDPLVVAGQGTVGIEIAEDVPDAVRIVCPVGGGGLANGIAMAVQPRTLVVGVRPRSSPRTIADGAAVGRPMSLDRIDELVDVGEESISEAMVLLAERMKQVVEGAGALALAAVLEGRVRAEGSVLVASGGNVDPALLSRVLRHGLSVAGRFLVLKVRLRDRPGELRRVLDLLAGLFVNVVSVVHHRLGMTMPVDEVEVELTLECSGRDHASEVVSRLRDAGYDVEE